MMKMIYININQKECTVSNSRHVIFSLLRRSHGFVVNNIRHVGFCML